MVGKLPARVNELLTLIKGGLDHADRVLCVDQDWWALRMNWTVERIGFGARRYRDPRFDLIREVEEAGRLFTA